MHVEAYTKRGRLDVASMPVCDCPILGSDCAMTNWVSSVPVIDCPLTDLCHVSVGIFAVNLYGL